MEKIGPCKWRIKKEGAMRVDGVVFLSNHLRNQLEGDQCLQQVKNVATLPGIVKASMAMPDIHWGYGFPIGGVAAFDEDEGVVSPGGVGYDISCGVRLIKTSLTADEVQLEVKQIAALLFQEIPTGVGSHHRNFKLSKKEMDEVLLNGSAWAVKNGFGTQADLLTTEDGGTFAGALPETVSERAKRRGEDQLGTLGSGNHFIEIAMVSDIYDRVTADTFGLFNNQVVITIHSGSRGLGYQICDDHIRELQKASSKYKIYLPDKQLACAPIKSAEGKSYLGAMAAGANFGMANRQLMTHYIRNAFEKFFGSSWEKLGLTLLYDISHNIAKFETHNVDGKKMKLLVHRKGATRAFPAGHPMVPQVYQGVGQPVIIPGDMGRYSYILVGTEVAISESFGSTCHGAGRLLSRMAAKKKARGRNIEQELAEKNIALFGTSGATIAEEMPEAYKDVSEVVDCVEEAGLSKKVARLKPMAVIKG